MACGCGCGCDTECGQLPTRLRVWNPAGARHLDYRAATFTTIRRALLLQRDGEAELTAWQPSALDDLGLQLVDWWAYIGEVLAFYSERYAQEHYLRTAETSDRVAALVALLGYRPRPGVAATGRLAVVASGPGPLVVPRGFRIASKATPDVPSQVFEVDREARFDRPSSVPQPSPAPDVAPSPGAPPRGAPPGAAEPVTTPQLVARGGVLLQGEVRVPTGERLLLTTRSWTGPSSPGAVVTVSGTAVETDAHGRKHTRVRLDGTGALPSNAAASAYLLRRSQRQSHLATLPSGAPSVTASSLTLDAPARHLSAGDPLVVTLPGAGAGGTPGTGFDILRLSAYAEGVWYANAEDASKPGDGPDPDDETPIPLVVATLSVEAASNSDLVSRYASRAKEVVVNSDWAEVGTLLDTPVEVLSGAPDKLTLAAVPAAAAGTATPVLLEDANGRGAAVQAVPLAGTTQVAIEGGGADAGGGGTQLQPPLRLLWDLVEVSRGATVRDERLGTGDATVASQEFTIGRSPVTYLADHPGRSGDGWSSTIRLVVGGRIWREVPSLYGCVPTDEVFETFEDDEGRTHVRTGDGVAGRMLPSGAAVVASYRVGSGASVPPPGSLTQLLDRTPNLRSVRNPVSPAGGSDPQSRDEVRTLAPRSVLTFGRAISGDDYATVAAAAPGVARASAVWSFDAAEQRPTVTVYVGDDEAAVASARTAIRVQSDPNRFVVVRAAVPVVAALVAVVLVDPDYESGPVVLAANDAAATLFAPGAHALGEPLYRSEIERVLTDVPGVLATRSLRMYWCRDGLHISSGTRFHPGDGGFFHVAPSLLRITGEVAP